MTEAAARRMPGTPCWVSLLVHGLSTTQDFYARLFGWEFVPGPDQLGPYVRALIDGKVVAGIGQLPPDRHLPVAWTTYLATDDTDATAEVIRSCGGTVAVGPLDSGDAGEAGRLAIASDPSGAVFGIWQAAAHVGTAFAGTHGTPVWNELVTRETSMVCKFYQTVFGYEAEAIVSADFDYQTLRLHGRPVASLHGVGRALPRDRGPHWMTYFEVDDTDEATHRVVDFGGYILQPPREGANGRVATVADPEGAVFTIVRSAAR
ncbi:MULTISPECIES: VOC family protein [unclassified Streptomyces]|uniref:VOC family protein n=1 Tax=unclassified Streptomyces TaxID=2593676 RepID=UPI00224E703B|nr:MULTISPECIES: VOC family protein [unclassified Streptomyces]WSP57978.1 VOC family protein [Streptomyces sp. NBC_01241]WSU21284.1 VOC family protein [Streptomyces sp. NBC_01108]MCX4789905.1 VOC family protein [Streptomyces sp. NBC_01221]MCX4794389.1 VOC family protein [Streptomyces sp. NBC_01242]WSJ35747.1 VOC family protein [Streptomyces sp. NBC_01321]